MPDCRLVRRFVQPIVLMLLGIAVLRCGIVKEFTEPSTLAIQKFVATPADLLQAGHLPTYVAKDLSALTREAPASIRVAAPADDRTSR